jgi:hypothetical protein
MRMARSTPAQNPRGAANSNVIFGFAASFIGPALSFRDMLG